MYKADMTVDIFAQYPFGKLALRLMDSERSPLPDNFRLYEAGHIKGGMSVSGAEFKAGRDGRLTKMIPGTSRHVRLTTEQIREEESKDKE